VLRAQGVEMSTKEKILTTAKLLFSKQGYDQVSIRDIAQSADIAVSAVNYHFKSKENLLSQLIRTYVEEHAPALIEILSEPSSEADVRLKLEIFANTQLSAMLRDLPLFQLVVTEVSKQSPAALPAIQGPIRQSINQLTEFITSAVNQGFLRNNLNISLFLSIFLQIIARTALDSDKSVIQKNNSVFDPSYRKVWVSSFVGLLLDGSLNK
jgi:AcrR family transcriptional regulator